jgi:hypothetical protein
MGNSSKLCSAEAKTQHLDVHSEHRRVDPAHTSTCNVGVLHVLEILKVAGQSELLQGKLRIAVWGVRAVVLETVKVLVPLAANLTTIWLLLLHADGAGVWDRSEGVHDGEGAILVLLELLVLMAVLLVVLETVLVFVRLLAANDGTPEGLDLFWEGELWYACTIEELLVA